jgi:hypothetical protein
MTSPVTSAGMPVDFSTAPSQPGQPVVDMPATQDPSNANAQSPAQTLEHPPGSTTRRRLFDMLPEITERPQQSSSLFPFRGGRERQQLRQVKALAMQILRVETARLWSEGMVPNYEVCRTLNERIKTRVLADPSAASVKQVKITRYIDDKCANPDKLRYTLIHLSEGIMVGIFPTKGLSPADLGWRGPVVRASNGEAYLIPYMLMPAESAVVGETGTVTNDIGKGGSSIAKVALRIGAGDDPDKEDMVAALISDKDIELARRDTRLLRHFVNQDSPRTPKTRAAYFEEKRAYQFRSIATFNNIYRALGDFASLDEKTRRTTASGMIEAILELEEATPYNIFAIDIKPNNFVVTKEGIIRAIDIGGAVLVDAEGKVWKAVKQHKDGSKSNRVIYTEKYAHPLLSSKGQRVIGKELSPGDANKHALGATLVELAAGSEPLTGIGRQLMRDNPPSLREVLDTPYFKDGDTYSLPEFANRLQEMRNARLRRAPQPQTGSLRAPALAIR